MRKRSKAGREREASLTLSPRIFTVGVSVVCMILVLALGLMSGGCTSGGSRGGIELNPAPSGSGQQGTGDSRTTGQFDAGTPPGGGGASPNDGGGVGLNDDPGNAYPLTQQSLFDFTQAGIAPWGPVVQTLHVLVQGQQYTVNRLVSTDPFTAMYQMENGDIVFSNEPLENLVGPVVEGPMPPTETWNGPDGPETIFSGEIMVLFKDEVTQAQIEGEIAQHNLHVLMSWFEPPEEPGTGNAIASFEFRYDPEEFPTFNDAYTHFNADPLVDAAVPDIVDAFEAHYAQGSPNDLYYTINWCRQVNVLHVDTSPYPRFGPPWDWFCGTAVAVFDDGVARNSEDFYFPNYPSDWRKISWCGITTTKNPCETKVGYSWGGATEPELGDPTRHNAVVTHGTMVAGTITAATNSNGVGVAGLAPQSGVVPVRLYVEWDRHYQPPHEGYSPDSVVNALVALRKTFRPTDWVENVSVANHSYGGPDHGAYALFNKWFSRDVCRCDRLHVASAGNGSRVEINYPAALGPVLGVSGLITTSAGTEWRPYLGDFLHPGAGSSYYPDLNLPPEQRYYPVSGIYGFCNETHDDWSNVSWVTASPIMGNPLSNYLPFRGTSFAAPQVASLAALLRNARPSANYVAVSNRIVWTRHREMEQPMIVTYGRALAGLVDFNAALQGW